MNPRSILRAMRAENARLCARAAELEAACNHSEAQATDLAERLGNAEWLLSRFEDVIRNHGLLTTEECRVCSRWIADGFPHLPDCVVLLANLSRRPTHDRPDDAARDVDAEFKANR